MTKANTLPLKARDYLDLINSIKLEITKTQDEVQRQKAICYWKIGRHIAKHLLNNQERAGYKKQLYPRLVNDLKIDERTLQQAVKFHKSFPIPTPGSELSWTNYRDLLKISDQNIRGVIFEKVRNEHVTARELRSQIKHIKREGQPDVTLEINKGTLYTYRTDTREFIKPVKGLSVIDVGFGLLREVPSRKIEGLEPGTVVESRLENGKSVLVESLCTTSDLYTYRAYLDYVIDGDTVILYVDLGFNTYSSQKLRLCGIDTPELKTPEGEKAKTFVKEILKKPKLIKIKTYRKDKYDGNGKSFVGARAVPLFVLILYCNISTASPNA